jgi:hypothetical protein
MTNARKIVFVAIFGKSLFMAGNFLLFKTPQDKEIIYFFD